MSKEKRNNLIVMGMSFVVVCLFSVVIWGGAGVFPGGKYTYMAGDMLVQYVDFIHMFLRHLLHGESLVYSFEYEMGMPTLATYAYYTLSPFNVIFLLVSDLDLAAFLTVTAKLATAAAAFSLLLLHTTKISRPMYVALSAAYALCGYSMHFYLGIIFFDALYWMPILILAIRYFVQTGKWHFLCVAYAFSFVVQFYAAYMSGVFSFVVYVSYAVYFFGKDVRQWKNSVLKYGLCVLCAVAISAVVTLPAGIELFRLMASDTTGFEKAGLSVWEVIGAFYPLEQNHEEGLYNHLPAVYAGVPATLMSIGLFADRKIALKKKMFFGVPVLFHMLCIFWKPAYMFIHGFDAPDGYDFRFTAQISLWMLFAAASWMGERADQEESGGNSSKKIWGVICLGAAVLYGVWYVLQLRSGSSEPADLSFKAGGCILFFLGAYAWLGMEAAQWKQYALAGLLCVEIVLNGWWIQRQTQSDITKDRGYYTIWQEQADAALEMIQEAEPQGTFYRVRYLNGPTNNISMLYGYRGLGYFSSIEYEKTRKCLHRLGYATSGRIVKDYGSTSLTRMLFSQKYNVECGYFGGNQREKFIVDRNEYVLPLAYMVSEEILSYENESTDAFQNLNGLATALIGDECEVYAEDGENIFVIPDGIEIRFENGYVYLRDLSEGAPAGELAICVPVTKAGQAYAYLSRFGETDNDGRFPYVVSGKDIGSFFEPSYLAMPHIIPLNQNENGEWEVKIRMHRDGYSEVVFEGLNFAYENTEEIKRVYEQLAPGGMQDMQAEDGKVSGKVIGRSGFDVLFTSIPYDAYWHAYVDGTPTDTIAVVDGAFLAVSIPEGEHEVLLQYRNPWVMRAAVISILGVLLLLCSRMRGRHKKEKSLDTNENADE